MYEDPGLGQAQTCGGVKWDSNPPPFIRCIFKVM
jgi:hypothetical protein